MTRGVAVLGATGSIGTSALSVLARHRDRFQAVALTAFDSGERLAELVRRSGAVFAGLVNGDRPFEPGAGVCTAVGPQALIEAATHPDVEIVLNAIVGAAGLEATLAALTVGKRVALANKETLVMAGDLVLAAARDGGGEIVPVDSEHSAVLQCLAGHDRSELSRLILTASGGPFREWPVERLGNATIDDALAHPTWAMGPKITVDSATLVNKALEVIEAHYLFGLPYDRIEVVVHPQSIVHAFTEFVDGSVLSQIGFPTMELPILYALTYPNRVVDAATPRFDPIAAGSLTFQPVRQADFPAFRLGVEAGRAAGTAPAVFNGVNEVAVHAFLAGRIPFGRIAQVIERVLENHATCPAHDLEAVLAADRWARQQGETLCSR